MQSFQVLQMQTRLQIENKTKGLTPRSSGRRRRSTPSRLPSVHSCCGSIWSRGLRFHGERRGEEKSPCQRGRRNTSFRPYGQKVTGLGSNGIDLICFTSNGREERRTVYHCLKCIIGRQTPCVVCLPTMHLGFFYSSLICSN